MFVITCIADQGQNAGRMEYFAIDRESGGYPYWSSFIGSANIFNTLEEATKTMKREITDARRSVFSDGSSAPATLVHSALGLCNAVHSGSARFSVMELHFSPMVTTVISDSLSGSWGTRC